MKAVTRDEKQENHHSTNTISRRDALVTATSAFAGKHAAKFGADYTGAAPTKGWFV